MSKLNDGSNTYNCCTCGGYISWEHGGIVCDVCGNMYCCARNCVPVPLSNYSQSIGIPSCGCDFHPSTSAHRE